MARRALTSLLHRVRERGLGIGGPREAGARRDTHTHSPLPVSRLNARLFIEALNDDARVCPEPCESLQQVRSMLALKPIVVLGGLQPGQSTTGVAALCAEYCKAERVIFCTDVDGVYDKDPKKVSFFFVFLDALVGSRGCSTLTPSCCTLHRTRSCAS